MEKIQWWGYRHISGTLIIKRYFAPIDIDEAMESQFVRHTLGPVNADSRLDAEKKLLAIEGEKGELE